ncbi:DUF1929 domain-containing protein [Trebonia kvetii]|uniref:DUF1929 domain-containing protein n=1 Tax=Trebonia kvetii TaxID=2480626 RepID=A0A6P2BTG0_9ACTN|nr:galactose oxidase early set domain-containing protein [Trebonia kvetii]TVZ01641.1 DUF1929 domain-containing protein [Trebonia kvetii]
MRNPLGRGGRKRSSRVSHVGNVSRKWRDSKPLRAALGAATLALPVVAVASTSASAGVNLVVNPGFEQGSGVGVCWQAGGTGTNTYSIGTTSLAHSGGKALKVSISKFSSGERIAMTAENAGCAPTVIPGHQYNLGVYYMSNTPNAVIDVYRHDAKKGWVFWMDLTTLKASSKYKLASVRTPVVPTGTTQLSFGVALYGKGTLITDDYSMVDATVPAATSTQCSAGAACTKGAWQVLPFPNPVRSIHSVVLYNGDVLLVAGSGNDPNEFAAGTFESAVYDPYKGTFKVIPTPDDFFCSGHVQLANGNVLILGGNKRYPDATAPVNQQGYEGLNTSYIFNPVTERYVKENNLNDGHWYPSATELGNGDIISYGGLDATSGGSVKTEYFQYNKPLTDSTPDSSTDGKWLPSGTTPNTVNQTYTGWGLYPTMILRQDGTLFYTGSHVFGNNETPFGTVGTPRGQGGAGILDIGNIINTRPADTDPMTVVNGLQDTPGGPAGTDMTDQSMSVLLPPAQSQQVFLAGGGNINWQKPGTRLTDLINLNAANPTYVPGPLLPLGILSNGKQEPAADGKMYPSMVLLPNGNVFETGGGLIDREDPVYEASMINTAQLEAGAPASSVYTKMATDPVPRGYHSQSMLLADGRILSIGNNPGDGSFEMRISVYSPPYLFHGARPQITGVQSASNWTYSGKYNITTNQPITSAELIRPAAVTHQSDPNQRFVALGITGAGNALTLSVPSQATIAPPGWYMLFVTNANGVPSVAKWVHVG